MKKVTLNPFLDIKECWWTIEEEPTKFRMGHWIEVSDDVWEEMRKMMKRTSNKVLQVFIAEDETTVTKDIIERMEL
tara:strand:- start:3066 stop:3293 length:228 start_codon:yes stop_codon:yes gene_type:complete